MLALKVDENLPNEAAERLTAAAHDVATVFQQGLNGRPDELLIDVCRREGRVLVTLDRDFEDIRTYPPADYPGIIVLRPAHLDKRRILAIIDRLVSVLDVEPVAAKLWIVDDVSIRVRD